MPPATTPRPPVNPRHRTIPEPAMIEMLLLYGWVFECAAGRAAAARAQCAAALETLLSHGLGFATTPTGARLFDPAETINFITAEGLAGRDPIWEERFIPTGRALQKSLAPPPQIFDVSFSRTLNLQNLPNSTTPRITLPTPIACAYIQNLTATLTPPKNLAATITRRDTCFDIRLAAPPPPSLTLTAHFTFSAAPQPAAPAPLTEPDRALYLRPAEHFVRVTPRVKSLAASLAAATPQKTVAAFWNFLLDHLILGMVHYADISPATAVDRVLENRWADCRLAAALFISLCRAENIPARLLAGHLLYPLAPTNHFWAECHLAGTWHPHDFLAWTLSAAGRDSSRRTLFAGACDPRLVTEIFPTRFTAPMTLRLPPACHLLQSPTPHGITCAYHDAPTGILIYRDQIDHVNATRPAGGYGDQF